MSSLRTLHVHVRSYMARKWICLVIKSPHFWLHPILAGVDDGSHHRWYGPFLMGASVVPPARKGWQTRRATGMVVQHM